MLITNFDRIVNPVTFMLPSFRNAEIYIRSKTFKADVFSNSMCQIHSGLVYSTPKSDPGDF